jgi:molybdenum cofactor cytidylyltransferase
MEPKSAQAPVVLGAVILAAGRSSRMGRPKLLLPWGETSVLGHLVQQWTGLGARQIAVVSAAADTILEAELDRLGFPCKDRIRNPAPDRGMFSSIQCAARWPGWKSALTHWTIVLGDQPHLLPATLQTVVTFAGTQPNRVVQPAYDGRPRHPVLLPKVLFRELAASTAPDLKQFLSRHVPVLCECDDPGLHLDIDRPEDYQQALALAFPAAHKLPQSIR